MTITFTRNKPALIATAVLCFVAVAVAVVASGTLAATHKPVPRKHAVSVPSPRWPLSIFSRPATVRARSADAGKVSAPQGAVLANVGQVGGTTNELYAWHKTVKEDCLVDVEGGSEVTVACSPSAAAEAEGVSWAGIAPDGFAVAAMVPDGVSKIEVTAASGATSTVAVVHNVAIASVQGGAKEFRYTMPDGRLVSHAAAPGSLAAADEAH
jgi:hypothetical protein